jgi:hypothetical protein
MRVLGPPSAKLTPCLQLRPLRYSEAEKDHIVYTSLALLDALCLPCPMLASYKGLKIAQSKVRQAWNSMLRFVVFVYIPSI